MSRRLRILAWHVHGSYLYYLTQGNRHDYFLPTRDDRAPGYTGRSGFFDWPANVQEVPAEAVRELDLDAVLLQSRAQYLTERFSLLGERATTLPTVYLEHDPPREHPTDTRHAAADDPSTLLVHVTHFNGLMWDNGSAETQVIPHGVVVPDHLRYTGERARGLVIINGLPWRGRRLGLDIFERVRREIPLDIAGMQSEEVGGLGDIPIAELHERATHYRFLFNPIRYTSLGLAVCEAMMLGVPVVGLATTEMTTVIQDGRSGYLDTSVERLIDQMRRLLLDGGEAHRLSEGARERAAHLFGINRFLDDWDAAWACARELRIRGTASRLQAETGGRL